MSSYKPQILHSVVTHNDIHNSVKCHCNTGHFTATSYVLIYIATRLNTVQL